jgi:hypothetical protein
MAVAVPLIPPSLSEDGGMLPDPSLESQKTEKTENASDHDGTDSSSVPLDIYSAPYPDGGTRAWLVGCGVSSN